MGVIEVILISIAISLDIFGVMLCKGSIINKVNKNKLMKMSIIFVIFQSIAIILGNLVINIPILKHEFNELGKGFVGIIFIGIGINLLKKGFNNEFIEERLSDIGTMYKDIISTSLLFSLKVFFVSVGFSILKANILMVSSILVSISTLSVILGIYLGYFIGYEHKAKSYLVGGTILILSGIYTIFRL